MPEGATITIFPGGKLVILSGGQLHNSCGNQWGGIQIVQEGKSKGDFVVMEGGEIEDTTPYLGIKP
jgi:hypothetical protein